MRKFLLLLPFLYVISSSTWASQKDRDVTKTLLNEEYTIPQSTVGGLLKMIEQGYSWDSMDRWMAYHNLQRFYPYSEETSLRILDLIRTAIINKNSNVDVDRLLLGFYDDSIRSEHCIRKMREILRLLPPSEAKRLVAVILSRFASERAETVQSLKSLLASFSNQPTLQILTAFNLLVLHEYLEDAEAVLLSHLKEPKTAETVLLYARSAFTEQISDPIFDAMKASLSLFSGKDLRGAEMSLSEIATKRK